MKRIFIWIVVQLLFTIGFAQTNSKEIVLALDKFAFPIQTLRSEASFDDIQFLKNNVGNAAVVGLGESTHGTEEYTVYKRRLSRFLIVEMGFRAIVDEGDAFAAEKLNDYINNVSDSLGSVSGIRPMLLDKDFLNWLREFNKGRSENDRVRIYGAEVRGFYGILEKIQGLFKFTENESKILDKFKGDVGVAYKNLTKADFDSLKPVVERANLSCNNSYCKYYLSLLNYQIDFAYRQRFGRNDFNLRDNYMFESIKRIISETSGGKVMINAHNGHLQKTKFMTLPSLGFLLNNFFKDKYFVIATDFNQGVVNVYNEKSQSYQDKYYDDVKGKSAIEYYLKQSSYPIFIIPTNIAMAQAEPINKLMNEKLFMKRSISSTGVVINTKLRMSDNYDLIVFFRETGVKTP